ncbi:MAG: CPBP family intramembrane glutamic endopeptidase [Opitutaceae bacterium]
MSESLDAAAVTASLIILGILIGSAALWIRIIQRTKNEIIPDAGALPWNLSWTDFLLFICAEITIVVGVQMVGFHFLKDSVEAAGQELTPDLAIAAVLLLQLPMLAVFYCARRFFPQMYASRLNTQSYSIGAALKEATPYFVMFLPVIWIVSFVWGSLLNGLQSIGLIEEFPPQELVQIFQDGGAPVAIAVLVLFAVILAPVVEEIIFRGCIYRFLKSKITFLSAQIISGIVFALMHANTMSFLPLVLIGIILARIYEKSGNLLVPMCFHAFFNGFSLLMLYVMSHSTSLPQ